MTRGPLDLYADTLWRAKVARQKREIARLRDALRVVATAIHRDRDMNACWLAGQAIHVHAVEDALGVLPPKPRKRGTR